MSKKNVLPKHWHEQCMDEVRRRDDAQQELRRLRKEAELQALNNRGERKAAEMLPEGCERAVHPWPSIPFANEACPVHLNGGRFGTWGWMADGSRDGGRAKVLRYALDHPDKYPYETRLKAAWVLFMAYGIERKASGPAEPDAFARGWDDQECPFYRGWSWARVAQGPKNGGRYEQMKAVVEGRIKADDLNFTRAVYAMKQMDKNPERK